MVSIPSQELIFHLDIDVSMTWRTDPNPGDVWLVESVQSNVVKEPHQQTSVAQRFWHFAWKSRVQNVACEQQMQDVVVIRCQNNIRIS